MGEGAPEKLEKFLSQAADAARVRVVALEALSGGAVQDNRLLRAEIEGGAFAGKLDAVLRMDAPSRLPASHDRAAEFAILKRAHAAGVKAPEPLWLCADSAVLGRPFFVMRRIEGEAFGHRLAKDAAERGFGERLVAELGEELAKIHAIPWAAPELAFLTAPSQAPARALVAEYRDFLDDLAEPAPSVEWGLAWLERNAPPRGPLAFCHRDFRTGNYLVKDGRLAAVLDWEFAGPGDPDEDLGWFLAKCWRFGRPEREAGGIGARETFVAAYERNAGRAVDRTRLGYWEVMAHVRWAVIALQQAERHASGAEQSLELALTAHVVPELELEILDRTRET
ncbi:MAG: aminoglycoside phosphotransferase [Rhodospirillales bacterium RIFCSPLOWO2_12_FULL_67_15]|nr:MAG: aminoglycoside phosphotransferase [Rhodospirillales bacterium RIFCSPLOWO2_12_FULL_67_15]